MSRQGLCQSPNDAAERINYASLLPDVSSVVDDSVRETAVPKTHRRRLSRSRCSYRREHNNYNNNNHDVVVIAASAPRDSRIF